MTTSSQQIILSLGAAAVAALLLLQHHSQSELQQENQSLKKRADQMAQITAENEHLSNKLARITAEIPSSDQLNELLRLRKEVATLRQEKKNWQNQRAATQTRPATPRQASRPAPTRAEKVPRTSWAFAGYSTPEAALQTVLWSMSQGKIDTYRSSLTSQGQELFASQLGNRADSIIASTLAEAVHEITELPIDEKRVSSDGTVSFVVGSRIGSGEDEEGATVQVQEDVLMSFRNVNGQWKYSPE